MDDSFSNSFSNFGIQAQLAAGSRRLYSMETRDTDRLWNFINMAKQISDKSNAELVKAALPVSVSARVDPWSTGPGRATALRDTPVFGPWLDQGCELSSFHDALSGPLDESCGL